MFHSLRRTAMTLIASSFAIVGLVSCDSATALRTGEISLRLTDAPGDVVAAVVTIDQIYLQSSENSDAGRIVLRDEDFTTNLLTLVGTTAELINAAVIPVGSYGQLRFVISGAYLEVEGEGGTTEFYASSPTYAGLPLGTVLAGSLQMPSLAQSGLKVNLPNSAVVINEDETVTLTIDFDVAQSFGKLAGRSGHWVMRPVLQAIVTPPLTP